MRILKTIKGYLYLEIHSVSFVTGIAGCYQALRILEDFAKAAKIKFLYNFIKQ